MSYARLVYESNKVWDGRWRDMHHCPRCSESSSPEPVWWPTLSVLEPLANTMPVSLSSSRLLNVWEEEPVSRLPVAELLALARWWGRAGTLKGQCHHYRIVVITLSALSQLLCCRQDKGRRNGRQGWWASASSTLLPTSVT